MVEFPQGWPPGCPHEDAEVTAGKIYRVVKTNPIREHDLKTHFERDAAKDKDPCLRCGLSVYRTYDDAKHQSEAFPGFGKKIAECDLNDSHGLSKLTNGTQPTHTTWWPAIVSAQRIALFKVVDEGEG